MIIHLQSAIDNASVQIGDNAYYSHNNQSPVFIGAITEINASHIRVANNSTIPSNSFLIFEKNSRCNISSLKGYFAELTLENSSEQYSELYAVSADATESSK